MWKQWFLPERNLYKSDKVADILLKKEIDFVILAGFLWLIPSSILKQFPDRIINIHPALLPKYGGKGMFGHHVHEAVIANKEKQSGITIHYVNEQYDEGNIIFQATCDISNDDTSRQPGYQKFMNWNTLISRW